MRNDLGFGRAHPYVQLLFFAAAVGFSMFINHPVNILISFICAFLYYTELTGGKNALRNISVCIPLALFTAVINAAFNHRGVVVLMYLPSGNPLTLESVINGFAAAGMVLSVLFWFGCCNRIFTADKIIYIFGKTAPSLALVVSMAQGFVPRFLRHIKQVYNAQKCMGAVNDRLAGKIKTGLDVLSVTVTWALENAADTADSMAGRGYGTGERTFFSIFTWDKRDTLLAVIIGVLAWSALAGASLDRFYWSRVFTDTDFFAAGSIIWQCLYAGLMVVPLICDIYEGKRWNRVREFACERGKTNEYL